MPGADALGAKSRYQHTGIMGADRRITKTAQIEIPVRMHAIVLIIVAQNA